MEENDERNKDFDFGRHGTHAAFPSVLSGQIPLGTGFTYQGQLKKDGAPVSDSCNLTFDLYDDEEGGTLLGTHFFSQFPISSGLITVLLNEDGEFGPDAFDGNARRLEIEIHCANEDAIVLTPRQELTPTPYAHFAKAASWDGLIGVPAQLPQACSNGEIAKWDGADWICAEDNDEDTLGSMSCTDGEVAKWNDTTEDWECSADNDTTYTAGIGLILSAAIFCVRSARR